jgi:hypothetical protein
MRRSAVACLVLCVAGCGTAHSSPAEQRSTAHVFAQAVLAGDTAAARSLVAKHADAAVREQADRLSAAFARHHGRLVGSPRRSAAAQWAFAYRRRINGRDGAFSRERGFIVVDTGGTSPPRVTFAAILGRQVTYSTHHDAELLPSKR